MNSKNVLNIKYEHLLNKYNDIDILSTFNKICLAQNLLKEMNSFKERFDDNKNKMIDEISQNCFHYYKKKILIKEINDNFDSDGLEQHLNYKLINNPELELDKDIYHSIYDFIFLIRNSYSSLIKIINNCDISCAKNISFFFGHLFYEDISSCSFMQEELFIFSFFIFKKLINKTMPIHLENINVFKIINFYNDFSFFLMKSLIKKIDIKNYFSSFIKDILNKIEDFNDNLSPDLKIILKNIGISIVTNNITKKENDNKDVVKSTNKELKKRIKNLIEHSNIFIENKIKEKQGSLQRCKTNAEVFSQKSTLSVENNIKLDPFFEKENINMSLIFEKITFYRNIKNKNDIDFALGCYFENILSEIIKDGEPVEIYSNILLRNNIISAKLKVNDEKYSKIINILKLNFDFITSFINILLLKIKENIKSLPLTLKYIFQLIEELFKRKYSSEKKDLYYYNLLLLKAKLYIGSMIIPSLSNVDSSGIFPDKITSTLAKNNMKIITKVLKKAISGNLFLAEEIGFTIFNRFICDTIPLVLDIAYNLNKDCTLPNYINKLFSGKYLDYYDYFKEKTEEKIQYQTICISFKEINSFLNIIEKHKNFFIDNNKDEKTKAIYNSFLIKKNKFLSIYNENIESKIINYYIFTKINYKKEFDNRIKAIIQDSFEIFFKEQKNDIVLKFKKCLSEVLAYINHLQNEDFISQIKRKENFEISSNDKINEFLKYKKNLLYNNTSFESSLKTKNTIKNMEVKTQDDLSKIKKGLRRVGDNSFQKIEKMDRFFMQRKSILRSSITINIKEELDFKSKIWPKIESKVSNELYYINSKKKDYHRILFCVTFVQENIKDLPIKYTQHNFKNIFNEIIQENIFMIKELRNNILNAFYDKKRNSEKINTILNKDFEQVKIMERFSYVGCLLNKIILKGNFIINISKEKIIKSVKLNLTETNNPNPNIDTINSFIEIIPKLIYFTKDNDLLNFQKKLGLDEIIKNYISEIKNLVKEENLMLRFSEEECTLITYELENYILYKLYEKLFPIKYTKEDNFFYNKCLRLNFITPENVIKDKKLINKNLLDIAINYIKEMDKRKTPLDKINSFTKAIDIIKNSIAFNSGKTDLGLDDTLSFIIYIILKAQCRNIYTTLNYCNTYISPDLGKKYYGNVLAQFTMVIKIIKDMKYTDLINVTQEQFGKD